MSTHKTNKMKNTKSKVKVAAPKTVGRPARNIAFPTSHSFTVNFLFDREKRYKRPISKVALLNKIATGLAENKIEPVGKKAGKKGRPSILYKTVKVG